VTFTSGTFLLFFAAVVCAFYLLPRLGRWPALLAASYAFYLSVSLKYTLVLVLVTAVTYGGGFLIARAGPGRPRLLWLVVSACLGAAALVVFKYAGFVGSSIDSALAVLHVDVHPSRWSLLLPIGLSFFTLKALSYLVEVYRAPEKLEKHAGKYALSISFFPQIFAGPIERPTHFLPQLGGRPRPDPDAAASGLRLMAWGYFKKLVIADRLAPMVDQVYANVTGYRGLSLVAAALAFAVQIYCDFSGYSDIAIGAAQVLGFAPVENFRRPYYARSVQEFWRRWHITLSTWFRDYLYIPLGGNRTSRPRWAFNLLLTFLASGLWHGAGWTFVVWGGLHGSYMVVGSLTARGRAALARIVRLDRLPRLRAVVAAVITFVLVTLAWVLFRAASLHDAYYVLGHLFSGLGRQLSTVQAAKEALRATGLTTSTMLIALGSLAVLQVGEALQETGRAGLLLGRSPAWLRWSAYYGLVMWTLVLGVFGHNAFIYFQF
jgi:alginate O-acetyltransferase complex protein AlgI